MTFTPFSDYLRIIGKGIKMSRPLSQEEAKNAASQIFSNTASPMQIGAFLLLLRYRGETSEEIAGLVEGAQSTFNEERPSLTPDIDWPSYADRHKQQPWFVLSALLLAQNGFKILMHGVKGANDGYAPTRPFLRELGIPIAKNLKDVADTINNIGLSYIGIESFCPIVESLCDIRESLGVRTVINTLARALNPLSADYQLIGVAHPNYISTHANVANLLKQKNSIIIKGGGGEAQRNPFKPCRATVLEEAEICEQKWPPLIQQTGVNWRKEELNPNLAKKLWLGEHHDPYAEGAIIGTTALVLRQTKKAGTLQEADTLAAEMWNSRKKYLHDN